MHTEWEANNALAVRRYVPPQLTTRYTSGLDWAITITAFIPWVVAFVRVM